jgi:hypothetical protein
MHARSSVAPVLALFCAGLLLVPYCVGAPEVVTKVLLAAGTLGLAYAGFRLNSDYEKMLHETEEKSSSSTARRFYWHSLGLAFGIFSLVALGSVCLVALLMRGQFPASAELMNKSLAPSSYISALVTFVFSRFGPAGLPVPATTGMATGSLLLIAILMSQFGALLRVIKELRNFGQTALKFNSLELLEAELVKSAMPSDDADETEVECRQKAAQTLSRAISSLRTQATAVSPQSVEFRPHEFFVTLWLRLGQSQIYTIGVFFIIWVVGTPLGTKIAAGFVPHVIYLPIYGFLIGLSVKAMEELFVGLAERFANAAKAFVK